MKKIITSLICIFLVGTYFTPIVHAEEMPSLTFNDDYTIYDALYDYEDNSLNLGDTTITKNDIITGINSLNSLNKSRMGGYEWVMTGMSTYKANGPLKGHYLKKVEAGVGKSDAVSFSFTISGTIKGVKLTGSAKYSKSITYYGPSGTEAVGSKKATHRLFSSIGYGKIMRYNYEYKDKYTGHVSSHKTEYRITNPTTQTYSNLAYINASTKSVLVRSAGSSKTKSYSNETAFKNKVNSESAPSVIDF